MLKGNMIHPEIMETLSLCGHGCKVLIADGNYPLKARTAGDEKTGVDIVLRTLEAPMRQIAKNAGEEGSVIVENIKRSKKLGYGFDAADNTYGDMLQKGIIDPTKVTRSALQNAASVAAMVLTTESLVCDIPKPEPAAPAPGMGGGDMY